MRNFNFIPHLFSFDNWWWYNNLIYYLPAYLIGAYIGLHFPKLLLENRYDNKYYRLIGLLLIGISFILWYVHAESEWFIVYSFMELIGVWFVLNPSWFLNPIPHYISCEFYMFALHNPILIPKTKQLAIYLLDNIALSGIEVICIKILQIVLIVLISCLVKFIICKLLSGKVDKILTGGR